MVFEVRHVGRFCSGFTSIDAYGNSPFQLPSGLREVVSIPGPYG